MHQIRIVVADDHPFVLRGVRETIAATADLRLVGEAVSGGDAQRLCRELIPDVLVLDLRMPGSSPLQTIDYVRVHHPTVRIVVLTAYDDDAYVRSILMQGVSGYVLKDELTETLVTAIRTVVGGGTWLSRRVLEQLAGWRPSGSQDSDSLPLTQRERQILNGIARGWVNSRIADEFCLAEQTVRHYVSNIYGKLQLSSRSEAIIWARTHGFGGI